ncbi:MAG TPA: dihydrolipoamide acetyltransferase family protein [Candidatus Limnocylindrales bacterium]|nr:dihydrolipoamide acetyltransferase family protein [Candidatus Limnocylindrales bacterium]
MVVAIRMPQPGQMTEECTVLQWFKAEGDRVSRGDPLFEIETDKSNMEIEAFDEGVLLRIDARVGATVPVDAVVAWIGQPGEPVPEAAASAAAFEPAPEAEPSAPPPPTVTAALAPPVAPEVHGQAASRLAISPRASRLAAELGIDPRTVTGTGPGGRIVERDVRAAADAAAIAVTAPVAAVAEPAGVAAAPASVVPAAGGAPSALAQGAGETLSRMRQTIARRLTENTSVPTFSVTVAVDMTDLLGLRADFKAAGSGITVTDLVHAATVQALGELPMLNASTDGTTVWKHEHVQLGVAVSVPAGLLVPVVRDADLLSVRGLHDRTAEVVTAARAGKLAPDQLTGSTFSVSNMGMFGVEQFTAIINPGESGILAVSSVTPEVRVLGDGIAVRQMMRITLTADHRIIDGEMGARFVNAVQRRLEDADAFRDQVPTG